MRKDVGVDGDAQRISQMVWLIFLKIFDDKEQEWQLPCQDINRRCQADCAGQTGRKTRRVLQGRI
nr:hypothetical protein [Nitrosomonas communis]